MKKKSFAVAVFVSILAIAMGAYFILHLVVGAKNITTWSENDIGKIKYVDSNGNSVFASTNAVVFEMPIRALSIDVEGDVAHITGFDFSIVRAPAYGVVESVGQGTITINHGNSTTSTISGLLQVGVKKGDLVSAKQPIGTTKNNIDFSVEVSSLPLDMQWLAGSGLE